jgi:voltage-gated potassium channel
MTSVTSTWRTLAYGLLEGRESGCRYSKLFSRFIVTLIVINGVAVILESNPGIHSAYLEQFAAFELFSVIVFTVEYVTRLWVATEQERYADMAPWRARLLYSFRPMALVDLLAILPFYLSMFIPIDLRYLRLFRLLRLLKLSHYFDGLQVFTTVLRREAGAIAGAMLTMTILIILSACLMFTVENAARPGHFESISQAIWWAVVTLTTVGYGDITPITFGGKLLAIAIMMLGIGTMALPAGILAARFSEELHSRRELIKGRVISALQDGRIDPCEEQAIQELQEELGLSAEVLERIIANQRRLMADHKFCPHCGEFIGHHQ